MFGKPARIWLTRDSRNSAKNNSPYNIYFGKPSRELLYFNGTWDDYDLFMCADKFHAAFPDVELNPGEGPIEVRFECYEIRNGKVIKE